MEYKEIVSVTGLGGLFHLLTTKSDGAIVRNISDKSTKFISARKHNVTPLESIEVYTTGENVRLHEVFQNMKDIESKTAPVDAKASGDDIRAYFTTVLPEFDHDRVYVSDMKKMLKWYQLLKENDLLNFDVATEEETKEEQPETLAEEAPAEEKPKKKAAKKAPAKKKAAAKKAADGEKEAAPKKTAKKKKED